MTVKVSLYYPTVCLYAQLETEKNESVLTVNVQFKSHQLLFPFISRLWIQCRKMAQRGSDAFTCLWSCQMPQIPPPHSLSSSLNSPGGVISLLRHKKRRKMCGWFSLWHKISTCRVQKQQVEEKEWAKSIHTDTSLSSLRRLCTDH